MGIGLEEISTREMVMCLANVTCAESKHMYEICPKDVRYQGSLLRLKFICIWRPFAVPKKIKISCKVFLQIWCTWCRWWRWRVYFLVSLFIACYSYVTRSYFAKRVFVKPPRIQYNHNINNLHTTVLVHPSSYLSLYKIIQHIYTIQIE